MTVEINELINQVNNEIKNQPGNKSPAAIPEWFNLNKRKALLNAVQEAPVAHKIETLNRMNADVKNLEKFFEPGKNLALIENLKKLTTVINSLIQDCEKNYSVAPKIEEPKKKNPSSPLNIQLKPPLN